MSINPVLYPEGYPDWPITIIEKLGAGTHAVVWKVQTIIGILALKIHNPGKWFFVESQEEARRLKTFYEDRAPHIVCYRWDFFVAPVCYEKTHPDLCIRHRKGDEDRHAILMDLVCPDMYEIFLGNCLGDEPKTRLISTQLESIAKQALETLNYLGSKGRIYGDLKTNNMSYDESTDQLTLYDFGFAGKVEDTDSEAIYQVRNYRAPERLLFKPIDLDIDLWSLGAILFEFYTRHQLFAVQGKDCAPITTSDHFHIMIHQLGVAPTKEFIQKNSKYASIFNEDGSLIHPPTSRAQKIMDLYSRLAENFFFQFKGKPRPQIARWEAIVYYSAERRGASSFDAARIIALIAPMLRYTNRRPPPHIV